MKLLNFIKKISKNNSSEIVIQQSEEEYYEQLFTKNLKWSSPNPNYEEELRWKIIKIFVEKGITSLKGNEPVSILDLGCGRGWLTNLLSKYGTTTGIEPVKPVVEYAEKLFPEINFLVGNSKTILKNNRNTFNFVVSSEVIEHVPDVEKANFIDDIANLLKPDGFLVLTTPRKEAQKEWNKFLSSNQPVEEWISETELENLVTKKHFKTIEMKRIPITLMENIPQIEVYQLWLFQKVTTCKI